MLSSGMQCYPLPVAPLVLVQTYDQKWKKWMNERTFYYIFYTLGPTVLTTDDTVCDIFLINASCKLFALHHSTSYQPTPLPPHSPGWVGPPLHTVATYANLMEKVLVSWTEGCSRVSSINKRPYRCASYYIFVYSFDAFYMILGAAKRKNS